MPRGLALPPLQTLRVRDFSGGPNLRDAQSELADNESVDSWNMIFDERGGVGSRLGHVKYNAAAFTGAGVGIVKNLHYSGILDNTVTQAGTNLYLGETDTIRKTFTTAARVVFADFAGKVYVGHPVDGLFHTTDGVTWTAVADADRPLTVQALAVWQNKLFVAHFNSPKLQWSDPGDGTAWTASEFVELREKDDEPLIAIAGASGLDEVGRPGLLVFKRESTYRVHDSDTGAFETIDAQIGAASNIAVASVKGRTYTISEHGIHWTDGLNAMRDAADRFEPLWDPTQINLAQLDLFCAVAKGNRVRFSLPRAGSTANDLALELHTEQEWLAPGSQAASAYTVYGMDTDRVLAGSPTVNGQVYEQDTGGTDDGTAISWWFQTRWFEPADGYLTRMRRLRLNGRGTVTLTVRTDYDSGGGDEHPLVLDDPEALFWDAGHTWDSGLFWGDESTQEFTDVHSLGVCKSFSLRFTGSSSTTTSGTQLLGAGPSPTLGAFALYGFQMQFVQLGTA